LLTYPLPLVPELCRALQRAWQDVPVLG
jgi:hypothetical protein